MVMEGGVKWTGSVERGTQSACEQITHPTSNTETEITVNNPIGYELAEVVSSDGCTKVQHSG
jgi:hypothetical protein